ncbi:MAG: response regulator transcription factor [Bdellovibrionales bacterium]|nr:response regulator transcription factor [Bdellovibrionales bacterium]
MRTILAIDDCEDIRNLLYTILGRDYRLFLEPTAEDGLSTAIKVKPELVILDLGLPEMDGYELCNRFRSIPDLENIPIIILSGELGSEAHIKAYKLGADNYLEKPFDKDELLALVQSKLKFSGVMRKTIGNLTVDLKSGSAYLNSEKMDLTPKEFKILTLLWENIDSVIPRSSILSYVWEKTHVSDRVIDNHVTSLRKKLNGCTLRVESVYGEGYKLISS